MVAVLLLTSLLAAPEPLTRDRYLRFVASYRERVLGSETAFPELSRRHELDRVIDAIRALPPDRDRFSWLRGSRVLRTAMRSEAPVFSVVTRPQPGAPYEHLSFLSRLAETTGGEHHVARSTQELSEAFARALARMRNRYVLTYVPTDREPGWHELRVRLRSGRADVRARRGYYRAPTP